MSNQSDEKNLDDGREITPETIVFWGAARTAFHNELPPGTVHKAGTWGYVFKYRVANESPYMAAREWMLDWIRIQYYPHRPSRFACTFSCLTLSDAIDFQIGMPTGLESGFRIYRATLNPNLPVFLTDYDFYGLNEWDTWSVAQEKAHKYWCGGRTLHTEIVAKSDLQLMDMVSAEEVLANAESRGLSLKVDRQW